MKGNPFPRGSVQAGGVLDRLAVFRITYVAVLLFVLLYVFSVGMSENVLEARFRDRVSRAASSVGFQDKRLEREIHRRVGRVVEDSPWVRVGGVEVHAVVLGNDGTPLYVSGFGDLSEEKDEEQGDPDPMEAAQRLMPPSTSVEVAVPHNSLLANGLLVGYAAAVLTALYFRQRAEVGRQEALLTGAVEARQELARRAEAIERELDDVRRRATTTARVEGEHAREIESLRSERAALREKLESLERREADLLEQQASGGDELASEHQALEELLDEALADLQSKDDQIQQLQTELKRASKDAAAAVSARSRQVDQLARRLRTLYRNLEVDERAVSDLVALRDESMKLKAEEALKRLSDDVGTAGARRKVGGLPPGLPVFELGYAGKGRIYYTHGSQRRLRILCIGAKNTQKPDLEYLSRIVKG